MRIMQCLDGVDGWMEGWMGHSVVPVSGRQGDIEIL